MEGLVIGAHENSVFVAMNGYMALLDKKQAQQLMTVASEIGESKITGRNLTVRNQGSGVTFEMAVPTGSSINLLHCEAQNHKVIRSLSLRRAMADAFCEPQ